MSHKTYTEGYQKNKNSNLTTVFSKI